MSFVRCLKLIVFYSFFPLLLGCLESFEPELSDEDVKVLVVDGFLNVTDNSCTVTLSRTVPLGSINEQLEESGAQVSIEFSNGVKYNLPETFPGNYFLSGFSFDKNERVRLLIETGEEESYASEYIDILETPEILDITWGADERDGIPIYINTEDLSAMTSYYYWEYLETWTYTSAFQTNLIGEGETLLETELSTHRCWSNNNSTDILVGSSSPISRQGGVFTHAVTYVPWESPKFIDRYSILINQRSISKKEFEYLTQLKENTENLGTLFDPLPSEPIGNIIEISSKKMAVGFFSAGTIVQKRVFINSNQIDRPFGKRINTGYAGCLLVNLTELYAPQPILYGVYQPVGFQIDAPPPIWGSYPTCIDCRLRGGTLVRPDFWE